MKPRPIWKTKTFWLHLTHMIVTFGAPAAGLFGVSPDAQALSAVVGVAGIANRLITDGAASITGN